MKFPSFTIIVKVINVSMMNNNKSQAAKKADPVSVQTTPNKANGAFPLTNSNSYLVNFKGLNRTIGKMAYNAHESIGKEVRHYPQSNGIVGNLPKEWVDKIPKAFREKTIKEFYSDFKGVLSVFQKSASGQSRVESGLSSTFIKAGIIKPNERICLQNIGNGCDGVVYRLRGVSDDKHVIKVFYKSSTYIERDNRACLEELNRAAFWQKNAGKNTQMVRFYFGDADAGYMINKFVDEKAPVCKKYVDPEIYGLKSTDVEPKEVIDGHNKIRGFQIDYGYIEVFDNFLNKDKSSQKILKEFLASKSEDRGQIFKKCCQKDSRFESHFANMIDILPLKERKIYFDKLLKSKDTKTRLILMDKIQYLKIEDRADYFYKLAGETDVNLKMKLVQKMNCLPHYEIVPVFNTYANSASSEIKEQLANKLRLLPDALRVEYFKQFAQNADKQMLNILRQQVYYFNFVDYEECRKLVNS